MKRTVKAAVIVTVLLLTSCGDGALTAPSTGGLMTPDHAYEIDTWGSNSEVYEFTPKSNSNKSCVFVILDNMKSMGLQCFDKVSK